MRSFAAIEFEDLTYNRPNIAIIRGSAKISRAYSTKPGSVIRAYEPKFAWSGPITISSPKKSHITFTRYKDVCSVIMYTETQQCSINKFSKILKNVQEIHKKIIKLVLNCYYIHLLL